MLIERFVPVVVTAVGAAVLAPALVQGPNPPDFAVVLGTAIIGIGIAMGTLGAFSYTDAGPRRRRIAVWAAIALAAAAVPVVAALRNADWRILVYAVGALVPLGGFIGMFLARRREF